MLKPKQIDRKNTPAAGQVARTQAVRPVSFGRVATQVGLPNKEESEVTNGLFSVRIRSNISFTICRPVRGVFLLPEKVARPGSPSLRDKSSVNEIGDT